jgi:hypothetical protein
VPAIELGALLSACELAEGFQPVFNRLKNGERAAYSEMVLVSVLSRLGHKVSFAAPLEGKNLDAKCEIEGQPVYFEVTTPEQSEFNIESQKLVNELSNRLTKSISACRIEVELFRPPKLDDIQAIVEASHIVNTGEWTTVGSIGRICKVVTGQVLPPLFDGDGAQIKVLGEADIKGDPAYAIIRLETSDNRAKRVFNEEYHHFSERTANILVVNMSAVAGSFSEWENLMLRLLQPNQNRKAGAVILFDQGITGPPEGIRRRWRVIVNPYAHIKIPVSLVKGLSSLDESIDCLTNMKIV